MSELRAARWKQVARSYRSDMLTALGNWRINRERAEAAEAENLRVRGLLQRQWMPIESAPKTGEHILVAVFDGGIGFGTCGGKKQAWAGVVHYWEHDEPGWYMSTANGDIRVEPTHWQEISELDGPNFPRTSQNKPVSSGVEGAHEGTTADKSGMDLLCQQSVEKHAKLWALAESSLSSLPPKGSRERLIGVLERLLQDGSLYAYDDVCVDAIMGAFEAQL